MSRQTHADAEALFFLGTRAMDAGDAAGAEACLREALRIAPGYAAALVNLGLVLKQTGDSEEAEICYRRSLELDPAIMETYLNLGALLADEKRFLDAEQAYLQAIALDARSPAAWSNLGVLYACMKREEEAERCYRTAIALDDGHAGSRFNLSYLLLRQGRFEQGWHCLESRARDAVQADCPRWQGESLAGKSILISHEGGLGDAIQFCRYAAVLKARGATRVGLLCHPSLKALLATLEGADAMVAVDDMAAASDCDFWTPLLSLPYHCNTRLDSIPSAIPYLHAPADRVRRWAALLPSSGVRVGLAWKGNPLFENDADRSLPSLDVLAPLGAVAGVSFVSLQKGAGEDEAAMPPQGLLLLNLGDQLEDFADTAAVVMNLDLVICVDTAVAHLAGALGKPCWVMLPEYKTDWRWLTARTDTPWYPGAMRLFRQTVMGDWTAVVAEVAVALQRLAAQGHGSFSHP
ncbi:tetratricopeptide repeat protein [mine drainage metagenome]|uniref:Tetratricopeptide repeat protein n=1 Tax=mine drainage metagenome TaxID=410659 RepID=A0A1J5QTR4_9ZZZZ